ncbi:unnamed protein product [Urochloa decumbens]|uniref:Transcription repressor n=1 Tax=Urochloa decumbens TaxID=240449 RepID=A0ABC8V5X0_9POAL
MKGPAVPAKRFALGCGCKDAKSVSVSASATTGTSTTTTTVARGRSAGGANPWASTTTDTASSSLWEDAVADLGYKDGGCRMLPESGGSAVSTTPSFSGLLRELSDLEGSVAAWGARKQGHRHEDDDKVSPLGGAGLEGSVAVVKQSEDPLGDFRRSMLQMIVENGIVAGEDLREMLRRFLTLNAPHHHDAILRAFAEIWDQVFVAASSLGGCGTPGRAAGSIPRREQGPRTPPRHRRSPQAWRV